MEKAGQLERVFAILPQRLVPNKMNDGRGFKLLEGVARHVDPCVPYAGVGGSY